MMARRPPGSRTREVSRRTRAGSPNSLRVPPQTAPAKEAPVKGRLFALALMKEASPRPRARRAASLSMDGEMSIPTAVSRLAPRLRV